MKKPLARWPTWQRWIGATTALDQRVEEGTEIEFCRDMIKVELPDRSDMQFKVPDVSFTKQLEFDLGGMTLYGQTRWR